MFFFALLSINLKSALSWGRVPYSHFKWPETWWQSEDWLLQVFLWSSPVSLRNHLCERWNGFTDLKRKIPVAFYFQALTVTTTDENLHRHKHHVVTYEVIHSSLLMQCMSVSTRYQYAHKDRLFLFLQSLWQVEVMLVCALTKWQLGQASYSGHVYF